VSDDLPSVIARGASVRGGEYGWEIADFPHALSAAEMLGYACLGGQFQFRLQDGTCEMYGLNADSNDRRDSETWSEYCRRSCSEVSSAFKQLVANTDFRKLASEWPSLKTAIARGLDPMRAVVFIAYFVSESETTTSSSQ
jgi:hypothetical protein